jgi:Flp pilus assembly pilin Flp
VEYAILVGFIAVVAAAAIYRLGKLVDLLFGAGRGAFG